MTLHPAYICAIGVAVALGFNLALGLLLYTSRTKLDYDRAGDKKPGKTPEQCVIAQRAVLKGFGWTLLRLATAAVVCPGTIYLILRAVGVL